MKINKNYKKELIRKAAEQWVNILFMQIYAKRQKRIEAEKNIIINSPIKRA